MAWVAPTEQWVGGGANGASSGGSEHAERHARAIGANLDVGRLGGQPPPLLGGPQVDLVKVVPGGRRDRPGLLDRGANPVGRSGPIPGGDHAKLSPLGVEEAQANRTLRVGPSPFLDSRRRRSDRRCPSQR